MLLAATSGTPGIEKIASDLPFQPPGWLRNPHLQSVMTSLPLWQPAARRRARHLLLASRELLLDCGAGVRLLAMHATQEAIGHPPATRLVVLLHGWEGSADSPYLMSLGQAAFANGFDVIRLNLRDHGPTHHLNRELFHSCRIDEVVGAVRRIQQLNPAQQLSLAGYSLGGNFALRVGARARQAGLNLKRIVVVCPVLEPAVTLDALERGAVLYRQYFILKWRRSLVRKQRAWPGVFDFSELMSERSLTCMTAKMVEAHTGYPDLGSYLSGYAVTDDALAMLETETTIITALDDPMILPQDLTRLRHVPALSVAVTPYGGHCGFIDRLAGPSWVEAQIMRCLLRD